MHLKTGSWDSTATVQVDVGSSGEVLGAGGDGGRGADGINNNGQPGGDGTSALGIEHNGVTVNIASGGVLRAGFGGGGGGGGGRQTDKRRDRRAGGGGGGGGLVALLVMVDKVEILEEDLDLVVDNQWSRY